MISSTISTLVVLALLALMAEAQRGRLNKPDTCPEMIACLNEFNRQMSQCEMNGGNNAQQQRINQIGVNQCSTDLTGLKNSKRQAQVRRQAMLYCQNSRSSVNSNSRQCFRAARQCRKECLQYKQGCLKAAICHEKYETGSLHDEIHGYNLRLLTGQECIRKLAVQAGGVRNLLNGNGNNGNNNIQPQQFRSQFNQNFGGNQYGFGGQQQVRNGGIIDFAEVSNDLPGSESMFED